MDGRKKRQNVINRSKRSSEPTRLTATMLLESKSSTNRRGSNSKSTIWDTLDEAKKKQEKIRNRVRKYGQDNDDSDYYDSPSYDAPLNGTASYDCDTNLEVHEKVTVSSECHMDECYDEFDFEPPLHSTEEKGENPSSPRRYYSQLSGSNFTASQGESHHSETSQINTNPKVSKLYSVNSQTQQSQTRIKFPARSEKQPVLTPEEAIRLVMERHSYISDSERTEDDHPLPTRKFSKGSSSTNETASNTVHSDSGHNRTSEGKRVLVLRKKYREDTHPHTSNKKVQQNQSLKKIHTKNQQQDNTNSRISTFKKDEKIEAEVKTPRTTTQTDLNQSLNPLTRVREKGIIQGNNLISPERQGEKSKAKQSYDSRFQDQNSVVDEANDDRVDRSKEVCFENQPLQTKHGAKRSEEISIENQSLQTKHGFEQVSDYTETANEKFLQRTYPPVDNEAIIEKEIDLLDGNDYTPISDSDSDDYNNDFVNTNNGFVQLSLTASKKVECVNVAIDEDREIVFPEQMDGEDYLDENDEDDWRAVSWKTAKTSRSAASKFSKSSSTSIWIKGAGEVGGENNQDDDILFFDAIQEAGQMNSQTSTNAMDTPPTVITHQINNNDISYGKFDSVGTKGQLGWTGKITSFVGYTLGALSGLKDDYDDKDVEAHNISGDAPDFATTKTFESSINKRKSHPSPNSSCKPVPSRELEIIKKCQALMKSQRSLLEIREKENERNLLEDIRLRRKEEAARARVWREVMAYREMMEGMGKGDKLAPLNSKDAAQEYDDRLSMIKTLQDQEKKMKMHEHNMKQMEMRTNDISGKDPGSCNCSCVIS